MRATRALMAGVMAATLLTAPTSAAPPNFQAIAATATERPLGRGICHGIAVGMIAGNLSGMAFFGDDGKGGALTPTTEFEIGSITKVFITTLLALEVQRGRMKLDDPAQTYVPDGLQLPAFNGQQITLLQLATHRSSLPRAAPQNQRLTPEGLNAFVNGLTLTHAPGSEYLYSNLAVGILGLSIGKLESAPVGALYAREITGPLAMPDTAFDLNPEQHARLAQGFGPLGREAPENMPAWPVLGSAGALRSTLTDMMTFLRYQLGEAKVPALNAVLPMMWKPYFDGPHGTKIGLSWEIRELGGHRMIEKDGAVAGYAAYIAFIPETHTGAVVLANRKSCPVPRINDRVMAALNGFTAPEGGVPEGPGDDNGE